MMQGGHLLTFVLSVDSVASAALHSQRLEASWTNHASEGALQATQDLASRCSAAGTSGWKPAVQSEALNKKRNGHFCRNNRLLPRLYVLGAPKCSTTSFAFEMIGAGAKCAGGTKEYKFFSTEGFNEVHRDPSRLDDLQKRWEEGLPACDKNETALAADFTPEYLALVRHPILQAGKEGVELRPHLPQLMVKFYGAKLLDMLVFVVMLREPLARMQSWWYFRGKQSGFQEETEKELKRFGGAAWHSMYGWQLEQWTTTFDRRQFHVIPMRAFTNGNSKKICATLSRRLDFAMQCAGMAENRLSRHSSYPSLLEDTTEAFRDTFNQRFREDKERLLRVLVRGYNEGMTLAGFRPPCDDGNCTSDDVEPSPAPAQRQTFNNWITRRGRADRFAVKQWLEAGW